MKPVRAILIDPFACTVTEVQHDADDMNDIYKLLSHESMKVGMFEVVSSRLLKANDAIFVDEEGLQKRYARFFKFAGWHQPIAGKGLILGTDEEGDTVPCETSLDIVRMSTMFAERIGDDLAVTDRPWVAA